MTTGPILGHMTTADVPAGAILVGVDGSEDAERALRWATEQAALTGRVLAIVHGAEHSVLRTAPWLDVRGVNYQEILNALEEADRKLVADAVEQVHEISPEVEVATVPLASDARVALVELSTRAHSIVLGSRGRGPVRTALLGSVSSAVARRAQCPVVICRPERTGSGVADRVVVGVDGTAASGPALEYAFAQASLLGLPLTVMHCFWDVVTATHGSGPVGEEEREGLDDLQLLLAQSVAGMAEKYPDVDVTRQLARGLVDDCLTGHAPDARLVVVGRGNESGWTRFLHTSCAIAVLERAQTTVAVVPEA